LLGAFNEGPGLFLNDEKGEARATLGVEPGGKPSFALSQGGAKAQVCMGFLDDGDPTLQLMDKAGGVRAVMGSTWLKGSDTETRVVLPPSSLVLFDKDGKVIWQAPK
jgi:hypothetical protein